MRDFNPTDPIRTGPTPQPPATPPPEPSFQQPPAQAPTRPPEATAPPVEQTAQPPIQPPAQQTTQQTTQQTAQPSGQPAAQQPPTTGEGQPIWESTQADEFRQRWHEIQTHFVEDPQSTVTDARQLVDEAAQTLTDNVHSREEQFTRAGARSSDSTEGMRDAVLQYQHLLDRLLSV